MRLTNVKIHGGGNIITRHYPDAGEIEKTGEEFFLTVDQPDFTWKNFNAHSDQVNGAFNPVCMVRKAHKAIIRGIAQEEHKWRITLDCPAPLTKSGAALLINSGKGDQQIYLEQAAAMSKGSSDVLVNLAGALLKPGEENKLIGCEIRLYGEEHLVKAADARGSVKRIRLESSSAVSPGLGGQTGLDVIVNYEESRGAFGHTFYVGHNVNLIAQNLQIQDCAKRSFRVSEGGSQAMSGAQELTDYAVHPARGDAAFCNRATVFNAAEEFGGRLKLRRSKASSVYAVVLDMDDHSTYVAQGGIGAQSIIRNSSVSGALARGEGKVVIENSTIDLRLVRFDAEGHWANTGLPDAATPQIMMRNCEGAILFQNGSVEAVDCRLQIGFLGEPAQFDQWKNAISGSYRDCKFLQPASGLHGFTPEQRREFLRRQKGFAESK